MKNWLKNFLRIRHDRQHTALRPVGCLHRSRRLAMEQCEQRLVLSGNTINVDINVEPTLIEGGFVAVSSTDFFQNGANNFLLNLDPNFAGSLTPHGLPATDAELLEKGFHFNVVDSLQANGSLILFEDTRFFLTQGDSATANGGVENRLNANANASAPDLSFLTAFFPERSSPPTEDTNKQPEVLSDLKISQDDKISDEEPLADRHDISDRLFVPALASQSLPSSDSSSEGGALEIATIVQDTQRAYEEQLTAVIASNLDRDRELPVPLAPQPKPVVAELARVVAFEVSDQQTASDPADLEQMLLTPLPESAVEITPVTFQSTDNSANEIASKVDSRTASNPASEPANQADRIDEEYHAAHSTIFSQWPVLATAVASYLLIERNSHTADAQSVQTPPRRNRNKPRK